MLVVVVAAAVAVIADVVVGTAMDVRSATVGGATVLGAMIVGRAALLVVVMMVRQSYAYAVMDVEEEAVEDLLHCLLGNSY